MLKRKSAEISFPKAKDRACQKLRGASRSLTRNLEDVRYSRELEIYENQDHGPESQ